MSPERGNLALLPNDINMTTSLFAAASNATPTANNNTYRLSVKTVVRELRNRGWQTLAQRLSTRHASYYGSGVIADGATISGAQFKLDLFMYEISAGPLRSTDNGDGLLKIMVEACEGEKSTWNLS
jgi:hypothetical protein